MICFDSYVFDTLMRDLVGHDRQPGAYLVYLYLARLIQDESKQRVSISLRSISEGTGFSFRGVQNAIDRLKKRGLIHVHRKSLTDVARYEIRTPWRREEDISE
jgi:DNA-binding transcriptional regulator PaaX